MEETRIDMPTDDKVLMMSLISGGSKKAWLGITKLQKLSFLVESLLSEKNERAFGYEFFMHDQGPISKEAYEDLESLIDNGLVVEDEEGIRLSKTGKEIYCQFEDTIPKNISFAIDHVIDEYASLRTSILVDEVHKMKVRLPNGNITKIEDLPRYCVVLPNSAATKLYKLGKDYLETFRVLSDQSLRNSLREARKKGSNCSEYKSLVPSS
jgi:uncharacterized protein YwgA